MTSELRMREAKELTEELLGHQHDDWAALMADIHRKRVELDRRQFQMRTMIAGFEDLIAPQQQGGGGAARPTTDHLMFKKLKLHNWTEATKIENVHKMEADPAEVEAALAESM